ncbi:MAG: flavodoxin domain-containing protein [Thermodesulfobacteriota bacterium]
MTQTEVKKDIHWVGAVDWKVRDFHGYSTYKGTTYNAYLALDEHPTLFDTVKKGFEGDLLHRLRSHIDPAQIDYIVVNHVEMDHSGALPEMVEIVRPKKIFCSDMGHKAILSHFHRPDWPLETVASGQTISIGRRTVQFLETRMLHWPDSMFSYLPEDRLLVSSDAFGQHWATSERFDDQVEMTELMRHAAKYYANILLPYSKLIPKLVAKIQELGLVFDTIAPDHGLIWRAEPGRIIEAYAGWAAQKPAKKALIIYDTMWHSTEKMAHAIYKGLVGQGISTKLLDLKSNHRSDVITEVLDAAALVFGSPTLNNGIMPLLADFLTYLKGLKPENKLAAAFGSYGWSGEAVGIITRALEEMKMELVAPGIKVKHVPTADDLAACLALGDQLGRRIQERLA